MLFSWYIRWLYPASSEPPPLDTPPDFVDSEKPMPQFPVWHPHWNEQPQEPITNPDIPFVQSSWTMVFGTWFAYALYLSVEVDETPDQFFLETAKPMPEFPPWRPPDHPSYYNDEPPQTFPGIDRLDLPIWLPWRPIPHPSYYNDEEEFITPDKYESPWQIPRGRYFMPEWPQQPREPIPDLDPYLHQEIILPVPPPYFMPPHIPFHIDLGSPPPKCPPPCLRRPDRKC